jgi:hypothetical protein
MAAKGTSGHLDNTAPKPNTPAADATDFDAATAKLQKWTEKEFLARWQLTRAIKDVTLQKIVGKETVHEMWTVIKNHQILSYSCMVYCSYSK